MPEFYTWAILLINQQDEIGEVLARAGGGGGGGGGGQNSTLMHVLLSDKLKARDFNATVLSTYDFSTL